MKRPGRRKPKVRIRLAPMERGDDFLAVTLSIPEEMVLQALKHQIAAKLPKKMKAHNEQPVVLTVMTVELNRDLVVRAITQRPVALAEGTHDEVRDSLLMAEPVLAPILEQDPDDVPF